MSVIITAYQDVEWRAEDYEELKDARDHYQLAPTLFLQKKTMYNIYNIYTDGCMDVWINIYRISSIKRRPQIDATLK